MEGTERSQARVAARAARRRCSDSTRMEGTERLKSALPGRTEQPGCSDSTRMEGTERVDAKRFSELPLGVAATRPAWRVLKVRRDNSPRDDLPCCSDSTRME